MHRSRSIISIVAAGLLLGLSVAAVAAPKKKPPPPPTPAPPVWSWTGFYVGGNVGYSWGSSPANATFVNSTSGAVLFTGDTTVHPDGVIGGGQIGYNWQFGNWVPGFEADIQGSGEQGSGSIVCPTTAICSNNGTPVTLSVTEKLVWFGTVRARLGWTVTPETMIYATGGLAYGKLTDDGNVSDTVTTTPFSLSKTSAGWAAGGGIEGHLTGNWTWRVEYLFLELAEPSGTIVTTIPQGRGGTNNPVYDPIFTDSILRVGLNYKWP
jgi:outer membrane immunogenic protein